MHVQQQDERRRRRRKPYLLGVRYKPIPIWGGCAHPYQIKTPFADAYRTATSKGKEGNGD